MTKIITIDKYYSAKIDLDKFMVEGDFVGEWEEWKKEDGYTDDDLDEFIVEKIYEYGPPEDMYGIYDFILDDWAYHIS